MEFASAFPSIWNKCSGLLAKAVQEENHLTSPESGYAAQA